MSTPILVAGRRRPFGLPGLALSPAALALAAVAITGLVLRVWIYRSVLGIPNSDESVVGLMVLHAMHGNLTTFFWGQAYGGTQDVLLDVPFFWLLGTGYLALRVLPILLTVLGAVLIWRVGRRTIGEPAAVTAGALFWLWPPFDLFQLAQHQAFYAADVVYCPLVLLAALRVAEAPTRGRVGALGLVTGLALWETAQIVPIAVPAIAWVIWRAPRSLRHLWAGAGLALVGAAPSIVWNARHGWASLAVHGSLATYKHSLRILVSPVLPMTLGLRAPFAQTLIVPSTVVVYAAYALLLVAFAFGAVRSRRDDVSLLYAVAAVFPFVYAADRRTAGISGWPVYTVVLTPVIALLVAQVASRAWRAGLLLVVAGAISVVSIPRMEGWFHIPQPVEKAPRDLAPLIGELDRLRLDRVYADYWIAYRLDFATRERIVAVESQFPVGRTVDGRVVLPADPEVRFRPYEREVAGSPRVGFVFFRRTYAGIPVVRTLGRDGYRRIALGPYEIFAPPS